MSFADVQIPYVVPTALLAIAFAIKFPVLVRAWRDPDVRATAVLLALATGVFVSVTPVNIHRLNVLTGVPNFAAPWTYSLLTAFCATCLTMIMRWREEPSALRDRRMRLVYCIYASIVAGLWGTFLLAHVPSERIYDLDTYYASTPWMLEHILLYLVAHLVSALVAAYMIGKWFSEVGSGWLRAGLVCLQAGFASGLVFDIVKMLAIGARWSGTDWDFLSTKVAPPFALLDAVLVAVGFIISQAGPAVQRRVRDRSDYGRLQPLARELRSIEPSSAQARVGRWAPFDIRLLQCQQRIHDALLRLGPYLDRDLYTRTYATMRPHHSDREAHGTAGAAVIRAALDAYHGGISRADDTLATEILPVLADHLDAISAAVRHSSRLTLEAHHNQLARTDGSAS